MTTSLEFILRHVIALMGLYYIRLCFLKFLVICKKVFVKNFVYCWNFKIFPIMTDTSAKWRLLWNIFYVMSVTLCLVLHPFAFSKVFGLRLECNRSNTLSFFWNLYIFHKLKDTAPKWRHLWNLFCVCSLPLYLVSHPFVFSKVFGQTHECYVQKFVYFLNFQIFSILTDTSTKWRRL